ncbi:MAG: hypothetical protein IT427_09765 [Pirellulales bacterium]|nr:hypothetical protein [Pirellulales bacterium]
MRHSILIAAVYCCSCLVPIQAEQQKEFVPRACLAQRASSVPAMDGRLDDVCWKNAIFTGQFVEQDGDRPAESSASFAVAYNDDSLFIGIKLPEPLIKNLHCEATTRDGDIGNDDSVEVLLQSVISGAEYYHLMVNARGIVYDALGTDSRFDMEWRSAVSAGENEWSVEIAIPFSSILNQQKVAPGTLWKLNVCRNRFVNADRRPDHLPERSCWSNNQSGHHRLSGFGHLVFEDYAAAVHVQFQALRAQIASIDQIFPRRSKLTLPHAGKVVHDEAAYRKLLEQLATVHGSLSSWIEEGKQSLAAGAISASSLIVAHLPPYEPLRKDSVSQLAYLARLIPRPEAAIELNFRQAVNEYEHDGFTLSSKEGIKDVTIRATPLTSENGDTIPADKIKCSLVGWIEPAAAFDPSYAMWKGDPVPDLLEEITAPITLEPMQTRHCWVTVNSCGIKPGKYRGEVELRHDEKVLKTVAISVEVRPFQLPIRPRLDFFTFGGCVPWGGETGRLWAQFLSDHYVTYVEIEQPEISVNGRVVGPAGSTVSDLHLPAELRDSTSIVIDGKKWDHFERLKIIRKHGLKLQLSSGRGMIKAELLPKYVEYLQSAGFSYEDFRYKISDENFDAEFLPVHQEYYRADPKFRTVFCPAGDWDVSGFSPYTDTFMSSVSCAGLFKNWLPQWKIEQAHGKKISIYTNWTAYLERAPLDQCRRDLAKIWEYGVDEFSSWNVDIYPPLNYTYPYAPFRPGIADLPPERQSTAALYYFRKDGEIRRPISSKRLESIRDGIKDWMYLDVLDRLMKEAQARNVGNLVFYRKEIQKFLSAKRETQMEFNVWKKRLADDIVKLDEELKSSPGKLATY